MQRGLLQIVAAVLIAGPSVLRADGGVSTASLDADVRGFLERELAAHLADIPSLDPAPDSVLGAQATGEYTWGTFMRSLAAYAQLTDAERLADRDLARTIADIGLLEVRLGGTRFSQLYGALALRHFGAELSKNAIWQALSEREREKWRYLLDATRFYDPLKREVINRPENYLGVAARIAAMSWETGLLGDRALVDSLLDRAAIHTTSGLATEDTAMSRGPRGVIPWHPLFESNDLRLQPGISQSWTLRLRVEAP